ncbi:MAG: hypothetical protein M3295_10565 [Chloroflexota bacterium]|nr:hypothetical protein [Chloroflexota bacterium]
MLRAWFERFPHGWWGYHWSAPQPMSIVEIVRSGSLDARLAATLWAVMARRGSVMLAAEAPMAGKTTTLSALVDLLPAGTVGVFLRGWAEDFGWVGRYGPDRTYLLVNEMSDHLPIYLWGRPARRALGLVARGYGMGATMHADSVAEAVAVFRDELRATDREIAALDVYLQFSAYRTPNGMYRRLEEAWYLRTDARGGLDPVRLSWLDAPRSPSLTGAQRLPGPPMLASDGGRSTRPVVHDDDAHACLAGRFGTSAESWADDVASRQRFLEELGRRGVCDVVSVALAVQDYPELPAQPRGASIE